MQALLVLVTFGFRGHWAHSTPTLSLQKRERQGWGTPGFIAGKVGPAPWGEAYNSAFDRESL
jgi:hypothetical protein